jgi:FixJ family two-component response regulator
MRICRGLKLSEKGGFSLSRSHDRLHLAGSYSVKNLFVAVVDDDEALCCSLADLMRSIDYRVESFASAETLLMSSNLLLFDCVIADVHMPGISGLNLVRNLQNRGCMTPVILITALPDRQLDDAAISVGAQGLLRKPFDTKALIDCIERSLSHECPQR